MYVYFFPRLSVTVETALKSYNPLSDVWHGVDRSLGFHGQIPFVCKISLDTTNVHVSLGPLNGNFNVLKQKEFWNFEVKILTSTLIIDTVGSVGHLRSGVFIKGPAAERVLNHHCKKCQLYHTVGAYPDNRKTVRLSKPFQVTATKPKNKIIFLIFCSERCWT